MKLTTKQIRQIIKEELTNLLEDYESASVLYIFDFDLTVAKTVTKIIATHPVSKEKLELVGQQAWDNFQTHPDRHLYKNFTDIDYSDLDELKFDGTPKEAEITSITKIMKEAHKDSNSQIVILTARQPIVKNQIKSYLSKIVGIDLEDEYIECMSGKPKGPFVYKIIEQYPNINSVSFYDDSGKNINSVKEALEAATDNYMIDNYELFLVNEDGTIKQG